MAAQTRRTSGLKVDLVCVILGCIWYDSHIGVLVSTRDPNQILIIVTMCNWHLDMQHISSICGLLAPKFISGPARSAVLPFLWYRLN